MNDLIYNRVVDEEWDFKDADTKIYTHCYHNYPAIMIPQIAGNLMDKYKPDGKFELLFDPYMGSGTSLVEASVRGIDSIGTDLNPLAHLISTVKTTHYCVDDISAAYAELCEKLEHYCESTVIDKDFSRISNYTYWYSEPVLLKLSYLSQIIDNLGADSDFFRVVLSEVIRESSYTRNNEFKRFRMTVDKIASFSPDVFNMFKEKAERNLCGLKQYNSFSGRPNTYIRKFDSSKKISDEILSGRKADMIVTSPPYGDSSTTVAYGQFSRWSNEWFGFENARNVDNILMGGKKCEQKLFETVTIQSELSKIDESDRQRYYEVISFLNDYASSINNVAQTVRNGGVVCYVVGNRNVKGIQINLDYFTAEMFEKNGFKHNITIVRNIPNKRMPFLTSPTNKKGSKVNTMNKEYIVIMTKCER